ncbi:MAG: SUMF1/EgtB/PvdO family nonheme iron enzyme [Planctomycetota bacterium]|nr:SUMF1/EgtB/PvdO family nonheme iron enzyme [Planctomycetota bacterium]
MAGSVSDEAFARAAQPAGMVAFDDIEAARAIQADSAKKGVIVSLPDVLIQQGVITANTRENIEKKALAEQAGGIKQLGPYKLLKKLGEGGMGAVYLADDTSVGRKVAVKVLPKKYSEEREFLTRFRREAQATGKLNHVNIVMAYNVGEDAGTHYYAMEYCEGETLDQILKRDKVIPWDAATGVIIQVARGLKHAHDHSLIHRDIKPANIFICKPMGLPEGAQAETFAEGFVAKILDLGLSKSIEGGEQSFYTQTGVALGTPHYISPEQAKGEKGIDGRTDIYSLGATFYHLVTGQTPFSGTTAGVIMAKHLTDELTNPQDINPDIPDGVAQVIARMMAKEPADRYASCKELLDDLGLVIDGKMPSSQAIDVGKSSVAVARAPRRAVTAPRKTGGPLPPVGTRQQQPVAERRRTGRHAADDVPMQEVPAAAPASRRNVYIAAGVLGIGLITFIAALVFSGKQDVGKPDTTPAPPDTHTVTPDAGTPKVEPVVAKPEPRTWPLHDGKEPIADYAKRVGLPATETLDLGGGVKMEFVLVPAGKFVMGTMTERDHGHQSRQGPAHEVTISKPFYMGKYEVTVGEFRAFANGARYQTDAEKCGKGTTDKDQEVSGINWRTPGFLQDETHPVCVVSWNDAQAFCRWATGVAQPSKLRYVVRLPTEAEWEYACRAGTTTRFYSGDKDDKAMSETMWHDGNSGLMPHPVGKKTPNAWGLYDMLGNVWEWCEDGLSDDYYWESPPVDPTGPLTAERRVVRGGSWNRGSWFSRSASRGGQYAYMRSAVQGFRPILGPAPRAAGSQIETATSKADTRTVGDAWVKSVQALSAEKQVEEVVKKLTELNPGYGGSHASWVIDKAAVVMFRSGPGPVVNISPVRALPSLTELSFDETRVSDLAALKGMRLSLLKFNMTPVRDLTPLKDMRLTSVDCHETRVNDLSPLAGMPLTHLNCIWTDVGDLSPLRGAPLVVFSCNRYNLDLSPLRDSPLRKVKCYGDPERYGAILRSIKTLETINDMPVAEFWKQYPDVPPNIAGIWEGVLKTNEGELRVVFHLTRQADSAWAGTLLSLDQGAKDIPITRIIAPAADTVRLEVAAVHGVYEGKLSADGSELAGSWAQGQPLPLTLKKTAKVPQIGAAAGADRPWKPIFDGKTLDCLNRQGEGGYRVENGALVSIAERHVAPNTMFVISDGEIRVRFDVNGGDWETVATKSGIA